MVKLDANQWNLVYNVFSFGLISMLACTVYTLVSQARVLPKYRNALVMSSMVTFIAGYHYWRIFNSFGEASDMMTVNTSGNEGSFNEAYRYVDWLLTVPLLLVEVIAVLALAKETAKSLIVRLVPASAAMIALGYPGEISSDQNTQVLYGVLSTIPFLYILYVLFVELGKSLERQPAGVAETVGRLRLLLIATWGVYPIAYIFNIVGDATAESFVIVQVGYTLADVLAKCVFGLTILKIARMKSMAGYLLLAIGLINLRYQTGQSEVLRSSLLIIVPGTLLLIATWIPAVAKLLIPKRSQILVTVVGTLLAFYAIVN
jgi:bacteriorhodopsin